MKYTYLILGSSGQIGSALVNYLRKEKNIVIEYDIQRYEEEDLRKSNNNALEQIMLSVDFVFFLAFDIGGSKYLQSNQNKYDFLTNNTKILLNTFQILYKTKKSFIYTSSQMANMYFSSYGALKTLGEKYSIALDGLSVKLWNVFGLEKDISRSHVITDFIYKAKFNKNIEMLTDGLEERQFTYVADCVDCLYRLSLVYDKIDKKKEWHISSFQWTSIIEVAHIVADLYPNTIIIPSSNKDSTQNGLKNEPDRAILKYWQPKTSLKDGIQKVAIQMNDSFKL